MKFNPYATTFNIENALYLANVSKLVYAGYNEIKEEAEKLQLNFKYFDKKNSQASLLYDSDIVILAFRGTEKQNISDWITDIRCKKIKYFTYDGLIHQGFKEGIVNLWDLIFQELDELKTIISSRRIWLTGHSMGGALATLAPIWIYNSDLIFSYEIAGGYTFGSPRVGNKSFAKIFSNKFGNNWFRFVNCADYVTRIPRRIMHYRHVPIIEKNIKEPCYYFDENGILYPPNKSQTFWEKFWDRIEMGFQEILQLKIAMIEDHKIDNYIKNLERCLERYKK